MAAFANAAIVALLAAPTFATEVQQHIQDGPAIYKKVSSLVYLGMDQDRSLQEETSTSTLRCFNECVEQNMDAEQCIQYIQDTIGAELGEHEISNLQIKVSPPRTPQSISETYWMIGIPTNIYGEVDCDINGGTITYPWEWETVEGVSQTIPPVECFGLAADVCCNKVLKEVSGAGIPLMDINGNCLSCWVHQEPLDPVIAAGTGLIAYTEHAQGPGGSCEATELVPANVQAVDDGVEAELVTVRAAIDTILGQTPVSCGDFIALQQDLLLYGRAFPRAMSKISGLLCDICDSPVDEYELTNPMIWKLNFIKMTLSGEIKSDENCIIIYTDHQDKVMEPPKIGGSRHELDYDRDDPACDQETTPVDMPRGPSEMDCIFPKISNPDNVRGGCVCPSPYADDGENGCDACADGMSFPDTACIVSVFAHVDCDATRFKMDNGRGACVCIAGFINTFGKCTKDCSGKRQSLYNVALGTCVCIDGHEDVDGACKPIGPLGGTAPAGPVPCPPGAFKENGGCYFPCTAADVAEGKGACGFPFKQCLAQQCGDVWSADCFKILIGSSALSEDADAWMECLMTSNLAHSSGDSLRGAPANPKPPASDEFPQCAAQCDYIGRLHVDDGAPISADAPGPGPGPVSPGAGHAANSQQTVGSTGSNKSKSRSKSKSKSKR